MIVGKGGRGGRASCFAWRVGATEAGAVARKRAVRTTAILIVCLSMCFPGKRLKGSNAWSTPPGS